MSDIRCVVCGEPWGSYGVNHGDMLPWEAKLFRQGAGCPSCEGESNGYAPETLSDVENGDEDPMLRIVAREAFESGKVKWERPENPVHWTCDGCGVEVVTDLDSNELEYHAPFRSKAHSWYRSHRFDRSNPEKKPAHRFEVAKDTYLNVCECCLEHCSECDVPLCAHLDFDTYDHGCAFQSPANDREYVCVDCLSKIETEEADRVWRDCYDISERIAYIKHNRNQFDFDSFADMLGCVRGSYFKGCASELLS